MNSKTPLINKAERWEEDKLFYEEIWNKRSHYCEISGAWLGDTINIMFFHHILPKQLYPHYRHSSWNILICSQKIHSQIELNPDRLEEHQKAIFFAREKEAKYMSIKL